MWVWWIVGSSFVQDNALPHVARIYKYFLGYKGSGGAAVTQDWVRQSSVYTYLQLKLELWE